jgi:sortase (surface protein transpeptidase)
VVVLDVLAVGLTLAGLVGLAFGRLAAGNPPPFRRSGTLGSSVTSAPQSIRARPAPPSTPAGSEQRAPPVRIWIPSIGVRTRLVRLGVNPDGTLQVPTDFSIAGWYALGPGPGQPGAAVIAGHVDSTEGPAVFYRLGELARGDTVRIALADRTEVRFRVYAVREYPKSAFPTSLVYPGTAAPELRLVTCGGSFDDQTGHYLDNVVVFARRSGGPVSGGVRSLPFPGGDQTPLR